MTVNDYYIEYNKIKHSAITVENKHNEMRKLMESFKNNIYTYFADDLSRKEYEFIYSYATESTDWGEFEDIIDYLEDYTNFYLKTKQFLDKQK